LKRYGFPSAFARQIRLGSGARKFLTTQRNFGLKAGDIVSCLAGLGGAALFEAAGWRE
jgi:hypothetical protein